DLVLGQAVGEEPRHHLHGGFGHAVVGSVGGDSVGGDGRDVDDRAARDFGGIDEGGHLAGGKLSEEAGAFQVCGENGVPAFFGCFEQIYPADGGDAGVVDEAIEAAKAVQRLVHEAQAVGGCGDVGLNGDCGTAGLFDFADHLVGSLAIGMIV